MLRMRVSAAALCASVLVLAATCARAAAYTVDCNHEYTDCETELSNINEEEEPSKKIARPDTTTTTSTISPTRSTPSLVTFGDIATETSYVAVEPKYVAQTPSPKPNPRLLNLNVDELKKFANELHNQSTKGDKKILPDLSDVNLDDDYDVAKVKTKPEIADKFYTNLQAPFHPILNIGGSDELGATCKENGVAYKIGEHLERGCEEICECSGSGMFECSPRCKEPFIRRGRRLDDPLCFESPVDECCSIVACAGNGDIKAVPPEHCKYRNETYVPGANWTIGCKEVCTCEKNGVINCKPRCNPLPPSDKCINVQDPSDECCEVQVCDVSQDAHEEPMDNSTSTNGSVTLAPRKLDKTQKTAAEIEPVTHKSTNRPLVLTEPIGSVKVLQNNSVQVNLIHTNSSSDPIHILLSDDGGKTFNDVVLRYSNLILNLEGGKDYILKTKETDTRFNFTITSTGEPNEIPTVESSNTAAMVGCFEDGKFYKVGEEFHIGCTELCECTGHNMRECATLDCPNHVGLELMSKGCVRWAPSPPTEWPNCCPRSARCLSDGTCHYNDVAIPNWSEVPISLTGCEKRCFCENGELDCQEVCNALPSVPPQTLRCPPKHHPAHVNVSDEDCCKIWGCVPNGFPTIPPDQTNPQKPFLPTVLPDLPYPHDFPDYEQNNIHRPPHSLEPEMPLTALGNTNKKLAVITLQSDSPTSVKLLFGLPPVLVGLRGNVDLRYTDKAEEDVSTWNSQVFAPANEVLSTPRLEFRLTDLKPATTYKIRGKLYLHNLPVEPVSDVYTIRTLDLPLIHPEEEKRREIDSRLSVVDVNDTVAHVSWRHFSEDELQHIDGIQVRYRPVGTPIYLMTEMLHHSRSTAELQDLRPSSRYEASLVLIPPPRSLIELHDPGRVEFSTMPYVDPYNWTVAIEARAVGSEAAELTWRGVPAPAERWVRVYRAAHACQENSRRENDAFRLAARDLQPVITITGLEPNNRCIVWLELFLTNGKVKTSNVLEINTKSLDSPEPIDNEILGSSLAGSRSTTRGDYYGALVVVGVVAALGALTSFLLLLVVLRRHRPRSVPITPVPTAPRESSLPPYDTPAYKLELQQETMDL